MSPVVLERTLPSCTVATLRDMARAGADCLALHGVDYRGSLLGDGGRRVICFYMAPDAEAVRIVNRQGGAAFDRVWTAEIPGGHGDDLLPRDAAAPWVAVERGFPAPVAFTELQAREAVHGWCLEAHGVRALRSYVSTDGRRMLCLYAAPDAEAVRQVQVTAGMPFDRAWQAELYRP